MKIVEPLLGTRVEVSVAAESIETAATAEEGIIDEIMRLEAVFTVFDDTSALHAYRQTGTTTVPELQTVIELAEVWRYKTNGAFHPRAWSIFQLWNEAEVDGDVPSDENLEHVVKIVNEGNQASSLDLNGIAKGWIVEEALTHVCQGEQSVTSAWLNVGGDIVHRGLGALQVGVEDPNRPYDNVAPLVRVSLANEALATSGSARRWWTIGGDRYPKILDPRSGRPVEQVASATVIAADGATADVLATVALIEKQECTLGLVADAEAECLLVNHDGSVISSSNRFKPS